MEAVQAIYGGYVMQACGTFEEVAPDPTEMARRWHEVTGRRLPYLVAEVEGRVRGFAYAAPFRPRSAYRHTVEDSLYVAPEATGRGVGKALLSGLIDRCAALGYRQMVAVIGDSGNQASIAVHRRLGFSEIGHLRSVGFKLGRWVDVVMMQRPLGEADGTPPHL